VPNTILAKITFMWVILPILGLICKTVPYTEGGKWGRAGLARMYIVYFFFTGAE